MRLNVIVYNKTRKHAGHTIHVEVPSNSNILTLKETIMDITEIPTDLQYIIFGVHELHDDETLESHHIREDYTIYSVPTYVEDPSMPNL
ncbi:hypothetical protein AB6A40_003295 [Gnathostoma spinigerum]|uniref:Ubiquitin-like domain-containing protein n=1 Tax=Gnathostoma spinigerum TaxID=75299 RepID=A0ABD6EGT3_9BILA